MNSEDMNSIFEQINNLKKPVFKSEKKNGRYFKQYPARNFKWSF